MLLYRKLYTDNAEMINLSSIVHMLLWKYCSSAVPLVNIILGMKPMTKATKVSRKIEGCIIYIAFIDYIYFKWTNTNTFLPRELYAAKEAVHAIAPDWLPKRKWSSMSDACKYQQLYADMEMGS